jgi:hypothetical protein
MEASEVEKEVLPLRAIGECYPSNVWYEALPDDNNSKGGTAWHGEGFWKLHEIRCTIELKNTKVIHFLSSPMRSRLPPVEVKTNLSMCPNCVFGRHKV